MPYLLRSWADDDAGSDREISRAIYPEYCEEPGHPAWFPAQQLGAPSEYSSRYVAVETQSDQRVAYATLWELRPRRYRFDLAVRPEWHGQGLATQLLSRVMSDARALGATGLQARVRDDKPEALHFAHQRGFIESHRMGAYRLDFTPGGASDFPKPPFLQLRDLGFEVTTLADLRKHDARYLERLHELYLAAREGWPDPDPDPAGPTQMSLEEFKRWLDILRLPDRFFVVKHNQRHIAFTSFFGIGTAVHPKYRSKGIATLVKAGSIEDEQRRGLRGQTTSTASPAMKRVLAKLGYRRIWSEIRLLRAME
jgi:GNAT superfamily N-acetyltransferase